MGESRPLGEAVPRPLAVFEDGGEDGYIVDDKCMGTYIHGILDNPSFVDFLLRPYAEKMAAAQQTFDYAAYKMAAAQQTFDYAAYKEQQYDLLADHVRQAIRSVGRPRAPACRYEATLPDSLR